MRRERGLITLILGTVGIFVFYPLIPPVVMGLPSIGLLLAQSLPWNLVWWTIWIIWFLFWVRDTPPAPLAIFAALVCVVIYFEASLTGRLWSFGLAGILLVLVGGSYLINVLPGRRLKKWLARTGTLGGTVRTLFRNYVRLRREQPSASEREIAQLLLANRSLLSNRLLGWYRPSNEQANRLDNVLASGESLETLPDVCYAIVIIEAGEPPDLEIEMFMKEIIDEDLARLGYPSLVEPVRTNMK